MATNENRQKTVRLDIDIFERLKRDAKQKNIEIDPYVNQEMRKQFFKSKEKKRSESWKGFCPHCGMVVKDSTLKSEPKLLAEAPPAKNFFLRLFSK